jgi:hypothetical protein
MTALNKINPDNNFLRIKLRMILSSSKHCNIVLVAYKIYQIGSYRQMKKKSFGK